MRVLFTTTPGWGHIHPMVPLARAFLGRGDEVMWAAPGSACARLAEIGFRSAPAGLDEGAGARELARLLGEGAHLPPVERPTFVFPLFFGKFRTPPMLADLMPIAKEWQPSLVVSDAAEFAGPIAAAAVGAAGVTHAFGALLPAGRVAGAGNEVEPLWEAHGLDPRPFGGQYDRMYLDIYPPSLRSWETSHIPALQPLRPVAFAGHAGEQLPEFLANEPSSPLVYVTFGTVFNQDVGLMSTVIEALRDLPVRIVVTLGPKGDPTSLGPQPDNVHVTRYIPQTELLPRCGLVVSHAGSGTFLAALAHGLPQVCLPLAADQFLNAATCDRAGFGIALQPGTVTVEAVRLAAERVLTDPQFRASAQRLSGEISEMPAPEAVADLLAARFG